MTLSRAVAAASCAGMAGIQTASAFDLEPVLTLGWPWSLVYLPFAALSLWAGRRVLGGAA